MSTTTGLGCAGELMNYSWGAYAVSGDLPPPYNGQVAIDSSNAPIQKSNANFSMPVVYIGFYFALFWYIGTVRCLNKSREPAVFFRTIRPQSMRSLGWLQVFPRCTAKNTMGGHFTACFLTDIASTAIPQTLKTWNHAPDTLVVIASTKVGKSVKCEQRSVCCQYLC